MKFEPVGVISNLYISLLDVLALSWSIGVIAVQSFSLKFSDKRGCFYVLRFCSTTAVWFWGLLVMNSNQSEL